MADYKIKVGVELDANNFNTEIKKYTEKKQNVNVTAILDTQKVDDKIKKYRDNPKQIKLSSTLDMQKVDEKIKKYRDTPKQIKLLSTLDMQKVDDKIKSYNDNPKKIKVDAVLNDDSIKSQIEAFPKDKKIYLNAELDNSAISNAIKEFNNALSTASDRAKISVGVDPDFSNVETAIGKYSTNKEIQIYPKLRIGEIAKQIKEYRTTHKDSLEKIYLRAEFKDDAIGTAITNYRTFHGDKLKLPIDLTLGNDKELDTKVAAKVAEKTSAYQSKPVEVPVVLKPATRGFDTKIRKPIEVDVTLKDGAINAALENPKNLSRIPVDVRLKPKDINEEIRKLKSLVTEPLDVGVKLDETSANTAISTFKPTSLLDVGIDLNETSVNNAIAAFKPTALLNVSVDPNSGNNIDEKTGKKMAGAPLKVNVELDRDSINEQIKTFKAANRLNIGVKLDFASHKGGQKGVPQQIKEYKTKTKLKIGVEIDKDSINQEIQGFKTNTPIRLGVELNTENVQPQIDSIRRQLQELENINLNLGRNGNNGGNNGGNNDNGGDGREERRQVDETTQAYRDLIGVLNELNSKKLQLNSLDASSPQSSEKIQRLRLQIEQLENEYDNLMRSFNAQGIRFTAEQWNQLETIMARVGRRIDVVQAGMSDKSVIKSQTQAYKELLSVSKEISSLEINIAKLKNQGGSVNQIAELESQLRTLQNTYQQLVTSMETPLTADQWSSIYTQIAKTQEELAELQAKYTDTREELAKSIKIKFNDGDFNVIEKITTDAKKLSGVYPQLTAGIEEVKKAVYDMETAIGTDDEVADVEKLINAYDRFQHALKSVNNQLKLNKQVEQSDAANQKLIDDRLAFQSKIDAWLTKNSAAVQKFGSKLNELRIQAENCDRTTLDHLEREFNQVDKAAEAAGKKIQTYGDRLKTQWQKYSSYFSVASVIMESIRAMKSMFEQVKLIDSAMTELKKVTDETDESYNKFLVNAASKAKEIGTTIDGLVASTADFARLGYGFEDSQKLAEVANIYAVVGDEIEGVEDATQSLVSTLAAFKEEMNGMSDSDFAEGIVDKMNEVSNNFAISSGGIGEALQRSASSMAAANNSLDETIALITAANTVAQNPEKVGNAFKTKKLYCLYVQKCA